MRNSSSAAPAPTEPPLGVTSCCSPGIQFDDEDFSPEERQSETTRQLIWQKLLVRLRTEFSGTGMIHFEPGEIAVDYSIQQWSCKKGELDIRRRRISLLSIL